VPFNPALHASVGYIDKPYKDMLDSLQKYHKRTMKNELEVIIGKAFVDMEPVHNSTNKVIDT